MIDDLRPPYRIQFDNARNPYAARNALGIVGTGAGLITSVTAPLSVTGGNLTLDTSGFALLAASNAFTGTINTFMGADTVFGHTAAVDANNKFEVHGTDGTNGIGIEQWSNDTTLPHLHFRKSRGTTPGTHGLVSAGDIVGQINWNVSDGAAFPGVAAISAVMDGTPAAGSTPGMLQFLTRSTSGANTERMRIGNSGIVTVGPVATPYVSMSSTENAIKGVTNGSNAAAGVIGEYVSASVASGSAIALTTATSANVTSISLTAGDWDVALLAAFSGGATTNATIVTASISTTSATLDAAADRLARVPCPAAGLVGAALHWTTAVPMARISITTTTTVYFVVQATFTVSTLSAYGAITARRVR